MTDENTRQVSPLRVAIPSLIGTLVLTVALGIATDKYDDGIVKEARQSMINRCLPTDITGSVEAAIEDIEYDFFDETGWRSCTHDFEDCYKHSYFKTITGERIQAKPGTIYSERVPANQVVLSMGRYEYLCRVQQKISRR